MTKCPKYKEKLYSNILRSFVFVYLFSFGNVPFKLKTITSITYSVYGTHLPFKSSNRSFSQFTFCLSCTNRKINGLLACQTRNT